jgi:hypothetical protein
MWTFGGDVYAYNMLTGGLKWEYHTPSSGYESPYGSNPLWTYTVGTVADGKFFIPEGHAYSPPLFRKAQQLALNTTDGSVVWSIDAFDTTCAPAISDGIMVTLNSYDNQIYAYGKGASKVTVTAPDTSQPLGKAVLVQGTVTDISTGTQQEAVATNFPNGLPCISDESMTDWMEYVYMQQPCPENAEGVEVVITTYDPNGNTYELGRTTTDTNGNFGCVVDPPVAGTYKIIATFEGSESYYRSSATKYINVEEAPAPAQPIEPEARANEPAAPEEPTEPEPTEPAEAPFITTEIAIIIAVAVVAVIGVAAYWVLRKRK